MHIAVDWVRPLAPIVQAKNCARLHLNSTYSQRSKTLISHPWDIPQCFDFVGRPARQIPVFRGDIVNTDHRQPHFFNLGKPVQEPLPVMLGYDAITSGDRIGVLKE